MRVARLALVVMSGFLLVACGGSSNSASNSGASPTPSPTKEALISSVDACKLVTDSDATAATGSPMTNMASAGGVSIPGACVYTNSDNSATVFVFAQTYGDVNAAQNVSADQIASALSGQYGITNAKKVDGIGDKAVEYTATASTGNGSTGEAIFVFKSNVVIMILLSPSTDSSKVEGLARTAVSRL